MENLPIEKDTNLWRIAKRRANFKKHVFAYIVVNLFLWIIWVFKADPTADYVLPWPAWVTVSWGIGLAFSYYAAYFGTNSDRAEAEYEKLMKKQGKNGPPPPPNTNNL